MNILFVGDIFGSAGRRIVREHLPHVLESHAVDLLVINGENAAGGFGITPSIAEEIFDLGAQVITTGNHFWDKKEIFEYITVPAASHERGRRVIRPANFATTTPGYGFYQGSLPNGQEYAVLNMQGRVFMSSTDDPFRKADEMLAQITAKVILVDFHAEATSEKVAMGWYLDGRVTAVLGTHTHIPTADERVLPGGTAYQTDVGMSGPYDSVIGVETELVLKRFLTGMPAKFEAAKGNPKMCATLISCDGTTGRAQRVQRIMLGSSTQRVLDIMSLSLENQTARNTRLAELQTMLGEQNARAEQDRLIASPGTTEEVAAVLRWTTQHSLSVTPQGSGTKAGWLNAASADLTLSLLRLRSFQRASDNPQNVTVGAGIRWAQLQEQLRHAGQRLPLDAHRATDATVGGVLSTNDSGLLRLRHGAARELVTATTLVLADGTILRSDEQPTDALHPLARSYDLTQLLIGSFGTLAVLTEATLRTSPLSPPAATFTLRAPDALELAAVMKAILGASLPLERLQMRNESHAFALDVELATDTLKPEQERLEQLAGSLPCSLAQLPVWQSRSQALSTPNATVLRITALPAKLAPLVAGFAHLAQHPEYEFRAVADPTGIVTVSCQAPKETLLTLIDDLRARLASSGGTVTVLERGNLSEEVDRWALPPHVLEIMRSVKQEFDPKKILNPGRFAGGI